MISTTPAAKLFFAFINLLRLRIVVMVLVACSIGYILALRGDFDVMLFICTLLGTGMVSGGSCALNCYIERDKDALMPRTASRPIPAGVVSPAVALAFGAILVVAGSVLLYATTYGLCALLSLSAAFTYLALYTPAKRLTWLNTSIGAIPGAVPPLIGWAAARGTLDAGGWILFAILFVWQHTHFFPIAWMFKDDYAKAGFQMLPVIELDDKWTFRLTWLTALVLIPLSLSLWSTDLVGFAYMLCAAFGGVMLLVAGVKLSRHPSRIAARNVLLLSVLYLPALLGAVLFDRYGMQVGSHFLTWVGVVSRWI